MSSWFNRKFRTIKEYVNSQDGQQNITVFTSFISDSFKVLMASLLAVFIPQGCPKSGKQSELFSLMFPEYDIPKYINGTYTETSVCTMNDNFTDLIDYNSFVLAFNFIVLVYFIYIYYIELRREKWLITHLDYSIDKTDDNMQVLKQEYPEIIQQMQMLNKQYMIAYKYLHILYIANFIFSAILVIYYYYLDFRTITSLLTNFILCTKKINVGRTISRESYEKCLAISFYNVKNIGFNDIDRKFTKDTNLETTTINITTINNNNNETLV